MGFGIPNIGDAVKRAVHTVSDAVSGAAKKAGGAKAAEPKVAHPVRGAFEGSKGRDGFDQPTINRPNRPDVPNRPHVQTLPYYPGQDNGDIIFIDSKPKGGSNATGLMYV